MVSQNAHGIRAGSVARRDAQSSWNRCVVDKDVIVATVIWDTPEWAVQNFGTCQLGDARRTDRLMKLAVQLANRPDGSIPDQTETWADCKAAYRLFDMPEVTFQKIIEPHCRLTRESCEAGETKLIICDTTELDYTSLRTATGLGRLGSDFSKGFFLHTALMLDDEVDRIEGLAAQEVLHRPHRTGPKVHGNTRRRQADRESAVWGRVIDRVGRPPAGVTWIHVCDRGADDIEVMWRALYNGCGFVIRAGRLNRYVFSPDGRRLSVSQYLAELPACGTRSLEVKAVGTKPARTATLTLRFGTVDIPLSSVLTPWLKEHRPSEPLHGGVVELRELKPPKGAQAIRWVLYTDFPVTTRAQADRVIARYQRRPTVEDYHKAYKTGCAVEWRQLQTVERLERSAALSSVVAVRLLQLKTAARETPDRPARELVPARWIKLLEMIRNKALDPEMTIRDFVRELAGLGGFLGRKGDGEPGWITLWRGFEKLQLMLRGADATRKKCG